MLGRDTEPGFTLAAFLVRWGYQTTLEVLGSYAKVFGLALELRNQVISKRFLFETTPRVSKNFSSQG